MVNKEESWDKIEEANKRYINSDKAKKVRSNYSKSDKGKQAAKRYRESEKGKEALQRHYLSEKGKAYRQKRQALMKAVRKVNKLLERDPNLKLEDIKIVPKE